MSVSRYGRRRIVDTPSEEFEEILEERGLERIRQFTTPVLRHPTRGGKKTLTRIGHIWKTGDRYYKLAHKYYDDSELWWIIAWYNRTPTEAHVKAGDTIVIPLPLDQVLRLLGV